MNKTLIIPCCGIPSGSTPLFLQNQINGVSIFEKNISFVDKDLFEEVIIAVDDDVVLNLISPIVDRYKRNKYVIHKLKSKTICVAETVYETIKDLGINGSILIKDADTFVDVDFSQSNFIAFADVQKINSNIDIRNKSFISFDRNNLLLDILEKKVVSNFISTGVYGFASATEFVLAYDAIKESMYTNNIKIFISHIICYLVGVKKTSFICVESNGYFEDSSKTKKENLLIVDFDGTLVNTLEANFKAYDDAIFEVTKQHLDYDYFKNECFGKRYNEFLPKLIGCNSDLIEQVHKLKQALYKNYYELISINEPLVFLLGSLKNNSYIYCASTASKESIISILKKLNLYNLFDIILTSEDIVLSKPNPEIYEKAILLSGVDRTRCVIFEDEPMASLLPKEYNVIHVTNFN